MIFWKIINTFQNTKRLMAISNETVYQVTCWHSMFRIYQTGNSECSESCDSFKITTVFKQHLINHACMVKLKFSTFQHWYFSLIFKKNSSEKMWYMLSQRTFVKAPKLCFIIPKNYQHFSKCLQSLVQSTFKLNCKPRNILRPNIMDFVSGVT